MSSKTKTNNIENFTDYLINSDDDNKKKDFQEKDNNLDTQKKRVSYRAKANDFEKKKNITKTESTNKSRSKTDNLKLIKVLPGSNVI